MVGFFVGWGQPNTHVLVRKTGRFIIYSLNYNYNTLTQYVAMCVYAQGCDIYVRHKGSNANEINSFERKVIIEICYHLFRAT